MSDEVSISHSYALVWTDESDHAEFFVDEVRVSTRHFPHEYLEGLKRALIPEGALDD